MIRLAKATDALQLYKIIQLAFSRYQDDSVVATALNETVQTLEYKLKSGHQALLLFDEENVIGMCLFQITQSTCLFHRFCIHPNYQGKGISKQLLNSLEYYAKELNCTQMKCEARLANCTYYLRQGYTIAHYRDSSSLYVLEKSLNTVNKTWQCA